MRRTTAGFIAFLAATATLVVLPVYAAPVPQAEPVETSIEEIALGSVVEPEGEAVVTTDGQVQPDGVDESEATVPAPSTPSTPAAATTAETPAPGPEAPASETSAADDDVVSSGEEIAGVPALTVSQPEVERFSSVGITWREDSSVTDVVTRLRVKDAAGTWGDWTDLAPDDIEQTVTDETEDNAVRGGTAPYWTGEAYGVEVVVQGADGAVPEDVKLVLLDPGSSPADDLPSDPAVQDQANAAASMPAIITRAQWGADESIRTWNPEYAPTIKAATLHHTADGNNYTAAQVPGMMRAIYAYHTVTRAWGDIGYNVIVDKFGRIFEGRFGGLTSTVIGAHAGGFNTGTFGVSMLGNYDQVDTPQVVLDSVAAVMAWKLSLYGVDPRGTTQLTSGGGGTARYAAGQVVTLPTVFAHRDVGSTDCPGQYAYSRMNQIRAMVVNSMAPAGGSPIGNLEIMKLEDTDLSVRGWTFDPDYPTGSLSVQVLVDGKVEKILVANVLRSDVGAAYPQAGSRHGFAATVPLSGGGHTVCVSFLNAPPSGVDALQRCQYLRVPVDAGADEEDETAKDPTGNLEAITASGRTISGIGWAYDPDAPGAALDVHIYVNGQWGGSVVANASRSDVRAAFPQAGGNTGFTWSFTATASVVHEVCAFAINKNGGSVNTKLGCHQVTPAAALWNPLGTLDSWSVSGRTVTLSGWALDPLDLPTDPIGLHVYVDGRWGGAFAAGTTRPDVGKAFPGTGTDHGFSLALDVAPGQHQVCLYVINNGYGTTNPLLACRSVSIAAAAWDPFGSLDGAAVSGSVVTVSGWVIEPDAMRSPADVHIYVDGVWRAARSASLTRTDIARVYPDAGADHGYSVPIGVTAGRHTVCVYAINVGGGTTNPLLDCRSVIR